MRTPMKATAKMLRKAAWLISERGRARHVCEQHDNGPLCMVGAVRMACHGTAYPLPHRRRDCGCWLTIMFLRQQILGPARDVILFTHHVELLQEWADRQSTHKIVTGLRWAADRADRSRRR